MSLYADAKTEIYTLVLSLFRSLSPKTALKVEQTLVELRRLHKSVQSCFAANLINLLQPFLPSAQMLQIP